MRLIKEFNELLLFFPSGKYIVVHASYTNPGQYGVAVFHGWIPRDDNSLTSFEGLIKADFHR